ncbi:methionine biosynthesis protein MetW [Tistrella mobilis]|uniref:Methionine biosynthesis protein (MetW) n=2 Tax=Tistrella mobilis TaxID=171437 RepID=I3TGU4_TISMK|nr:putative methionine biosynthesis protein (MetW) [Tistrella mobilis KA081020-065]
MTGSFSPPADDRIRPMGPGVIRDAHGYPALRPDLDLIAGMVEPQARVLDIGCGDGVLLHYLDRVKGCDGRGIEISQQGVQESVARGLSVIQGDADHDLDFFPDDAFDVVVLSQTLQATRRPDMVIRNLVRIGRRAIVSFPNFGHWRCRTHLLIRGRMPRTRGLPYAWYDTPNIHLCTITDFVRSCAHAGVRIEISLALDSRGRVVRRNAPDGYANLIGEIGMFVLSRDRG